MYNKKTRNGIIILVIIACCIGAYFIFGNSKGPNSYENVYKSYCNVCENAGYALNTVYEEGTISIPYMNTTVVKGSRYLTGEGKYVYVLVFDTSEKATNVRDKQEMFSEMKTILTGRVLVTTSSIEAYYKYK
ncbi:MAG: hypothetical protein PHI36_01695 [Bacteroidales bacterium]|nr:hypothetical protein [Bacteroidales bacterium]